MKLIIGLGNPGRQYQNTRHNTGHLFISKIKDQRSKVGKQAKLLKTTVLMNESGEEVKKLTTNYRLLTTDLLVVHDDMDLALGEFKMQFGRSSAGHKGVQSVIEELGTDDLWRLRFGVGRPSVGMPSEEYVLSEFHEEEKPKLEKAFEEALPRVREWCGRSAQFTVNSGQ